ncbi:MAG: glycosyltransferase [Candidatus Bathyarchaeia archaeon]
MKILQISNEIRHELGCATSLKSLGYDITYMHVGNKYELLKDLTVYTNEGIAKVKYLEVDSPILFHAAIRPQNFIPVNISRGNFDLVIATPSTPFYLAHQIAKKLKTPLILRVWGIRANKLIDHIVYGKNYLELLNFYPSILHSLMQIWSSQALVVLDDSTTNFLRRLPLFKKLEVVYPTYAALYDNGRVNENPEIEKIIEEQGYVFSIVTISRTKSLFKLQEYPLFRILYMIAKKCPEVNVVIAGSKAIEARRKLGFFQMPKNLIFVGWVFSDDILKTLYGHASLVVTPVFFRSVSNRLLEALFYGKPILTNTTASLIHNRLKHLHHVFISDNYPEYPSIVRRLLKDDALLQELASGAKEAYSSFFSARKCGLAMKHIIESLAR